MVITAEERIVIFQPVLWSTYIFKVSFPTLVTFCNESFETRLWSWIFTTACGPQLLICKQKCVQCKLALNFNAKNKWLCNVQRYCQKDCVGKLTCKCRTIMVERLHCLLTTFAYLCWPVWRKTFCAFLAWSSDQLLALFLYFTSHVITCKVVKQIQDEVCFACANPYIVCYWFYYNYVDFFYFILACPSYTTPSPFVCVCPCHCLPENDQIVWTNKELVQLSAWKEYHWLYIRCSSAVCYSCMRCEKKKEKRKTPPNCYN